MKGGRTEPGRSPTGPRGRDPAQAGTLDWPWPHISRLCPVYQNTHLCAHMNIFESFRIQLYHHHLNSQVKNHRDYTTETLFLPQRFLCLSEPGLDPLHTFVVESPDNDSTNHFHSHGPTTHFLHHLLALIHPDLRQPGKRNEVLKGTRTMQGPPPLTSVLPFASFPVALIPSQVSRGFSTTDTYGGTNRRAGQGATFLFVSANCELVIWSSLTCSLWKGLHNLAIEFQESHLL